MLLDFIQTLHQAKLEPTPVEIVEALLLARFWSEADAVTTTPKDEALASTVSNPLSSPASAPSPSNAQPAAAVPPKLQAGDAVLPSSGGIGSTAALPFRSPRARALPGALKIAGALRPLRKRHASSHRLEMDEAATVQQIVDGGPRTIVWRPVKERWLSVALVLDESLSMHVWRPTLRELRRLLEQHGAFNGVNVWQLNADAATPQLWQTRSGQRQPVSEKKVLNPNARQLVIVVSDCTADAWHHGGAYQWLVDWARRAPTVLAQVLPRALWLDTSMIETDVWLSATQAGLPNAALRVEPEDYQDWLRKGAPLPVVTLDEWSIAPWAKLVAGVSAAPVSGFVLPDLSESSSEPLPPSNYVAPESAAARVNAFATASPLARELARLLAAVPLSLPVMQLVQQVRLAKSRQAHLAEIFRSELLNLPQTTPNEPFNDEKLFDFHDGVRDELLRELSARQQQDEAVAVLAAVEKFIADRSGQSGVFSGLIVLPNGTEAPPNAVNVDPLALAFARIGAHTLRTLDVQLDKAARWEAFVERYDKQTTDDAPPVFTEPELTGLPHPVAGVVPGMSDEVLLTRWEQLNENLVTAVWQITELQRQLNALPSVSSDEGELLQKALINKTRLRVTIGERLQEVSNALRNRNLTPPSSPFSLIIQTLIGDFERPGHATLWSIVGLILAALRTNDLATAGRKLSELGHLISPGNVHEAVAMHRLARNYAQQANDLSAEFHITINLARACDSYDTYQPSAKPLLQEAVQMAIRLNEPQLQLAARLEWAKQQKYLGSDAPALRENYLAALALARELKDQPNESLIRQQLWQIPEPFSFDTVTLDESGKVKERPSLTAHQFVETLAPDLTLAMVALPGGRFMMGAPKAEKESYDDERPQHEVEVSPFFIGKFTITQAQWRVVAGWEKSHPKAPDLKPDPARFKGAEHPVEQVSWEDAQEFCARLSAQTGRAYRLPTEAEWEYACRAGTTTPFALGETITPEFVNYNGEYPYGKAPKGTYRSETIQVGSLGVANGFGLYDMHGNVWEWCQDWFADDYYQQCEKQGTVIDPTGPKKGHFRALRGGSWLNSGGDCRSAYRYRYAPGVIADLIGFRVVVSARTP